MFLTGKAKESFEKNLQSTYKENKRDYLNVQGNRSVLENFNRMPLCHQIGIYVDWFDSTGIIISIYFTEDREYWCSICCPEQSRFGGFRTRAEARIKALEEAGMLFNQRTV